MTTIKLTLIRLAAWLDVHLIGHRFYWICDHIAQSPWWNDDPRFVHNFTEDER